MSNETVQEKPQKARLNEGVFAGQFPQAVASREAEAAMGDVPDERGYYVSRYDGELYAKVYVRGEGVFSDGSPMVLGEKRYFRVQPIEWYPFAIGEGKGVMVSRHVLFTCAYDMSGNDWSASFIRQELQNFALGCLDARTKSRIVELPLDNDCEGQEVTLDGRAFFLTPDAAPWCLQPVTWDGVFLFSRVEWQGLQSPDRPFDPTDYAKAMGATVTPVGFGTGWLRTADATSSRAAVFGLDHLDPSLVSPDTGREVTSELGVVPVLSVKFNG